MQARCLMSRTARHMDKPLLRRRRIGGRRAPPMLRPIFAVDGRSDRRDRLAGGVSFDHLPGDVQTNDSRKRVQVPLRTTVVSSPLDVAGVIAGVSIALAAAITRDVLQKITSSSRIRVHRAHLFDGSQGRPGRGGQRRPSGVPRGVCCANHERLWLRRFEQGVVPRDPAKEQPEEQRESCNQRPHLR